MKFTVKCIPLALTLPESLAFPKCAKLVSRVCPALSSCSLLNGYFQLQVCEVFLPYWFHSSYNNRAHRILSLSSVKSPILLLMVNLWSLTMRKVYSSTYRSENLLKKNRGVVPGVVIYLSSLTTSLNGLINGLMACAIGALRMLMSELTAKMQCKEDMYVCPLTRDIYIYIDLALCYVL